MLEQAGHTALLLDGPLQGLDNGALAERVAALAPDITMVLTAPTYLFWRCAPPELRVPAAFLQQLAGRGGTTVIAGPHGSVTPGPALAKTRRRPRRHGRMRGGDHRGRRQWRRAGAAHGMAQSGRQRDLE